MNQEKQGLFSIENYLPEGYKELKKSVPKSEMEEHFFQWLWCKKE